MTIEKLVEETKAGLAKGIDILEILYVIDRKATKADAKIIAGLLSEGDLYKDDDRSDRTKTLEILGNIGDDNTIIALEKARALFLDIDYDRMGLSAERCNKLDMDDIDDAIEKIKTRLRIDPS